jgi:hypothetical protein
MQTLCYAISRPRIFFFHFINNFCSWFHSLFAIFSKHGSWIDDILLLLRNDAADVVCENLLDGKCDGLHNVLVEVLLDVGLVEPVVTDEFALAVADLDTGIAVSLSAVKFLDVVLVIVTDVLAKCRLFVELGLFPLRAVGIFDVIGTLVPILENGHGVFVVLNNHESSVGVRSVESIRVILRLLRVPRVLGHDERMLGLNIPVVEHPLDRNVQETECSISIEEDNKLIILDVVCECRRLDPGRMAVFKVVGVQELVVVSVNLSVGVVVEDAARDVVEITPIEFAILVLLGGLESPSLQIQDEYFTAQFLLVARVCGKLDEIAVRFADVRLGRSSLYVVEEYSDNVVDGEVSLGG